MDTDSETGKAAGFIDIERLFVALVAWTAVGLLLIGLVLSAEAVLSVFNLLPRFLSVLGVLTERVSLALALAGWGLGVVGICTAMGIRAVLRNPVVLPWTEGLFPHPR